MYKPIFYTVVFASLSTILVYGFGAREEPAPTPSDLKPPTEKPYKLKNGDLRLGDITLHTRLREISFPAYLNNPDLGSLEVLIVSPPPRGRTHEGLVITEASPFQLETLLYILGAKSDTQRTVTNKKGDLINIDIEWQDSHGQLHREAVENWVLDERTGRPMVRQGFYFTGSSFFQGIYQAEGSGNLCLLYSNTAATVLDSADEDSDKDILYVTNPDKLQPGAYQDVRVILSIRKER